MALGVHRVTDIARQLIMAAAFGNLSVAKSSIILPATTAQNDTVDFLELPAGTRIIDCLVRLTAAAAGVVTFQLGLAQKPGHASTQVDADALLTAAAITTTANFRRRNNAAVGYAALTLADKYLLQGLVGAAALGATPVTVDVELFYEYVGTP